jgi:replicative DNA helicase
MALSQLSRAPDQRPDHTPVLSDLRESGSIEQDADIVMFIYRDVKYNPDTDKPHVADILVAKHRNGPTGSIHLFYQDALMKFLDLSVHGAG